VIKIDDIEKLGREAVRNISKERNGNADVDLDEQMGWTEG